MDFFKKLLDLVTTILTKFIPGRKERALDQYQKTNKDVQERQRKREARRNADKEAKSIFNAASYHDCDRDGC